MTLVEKFKQPVLKEFQQFEEMYASVFETDNPLLRLVYGQILSTKGKQLRPILVLLTAKLCGGVSEKTLYSAVVLEMLHAVSLIHDDVVDMTLQRRGKKTVNAAFGNQTAVLSGDYLLSKTMAICFEHLEGKRLSYCLSNLTKELSDGELLQQYYSQKKEWDEDKYYRIINKKTAVLFSTCTQVAAISANVEDAQIALLRDFGTSLGISFQIRDDVFDYSPSLKTGKPAFNDVREGKITLPLIHALEQASIDERRFFSEIMEKDTFLESETSGLLSLVEKYGGIAYATSQMLEHQKKAQALLSDFPDSEAKEALFSLSDYVGSRMK